MWSKLATPAVMALGLMGPSATQAEFNSSSHPGTQVFYYSQWAVYGGSSPPANKNTAYGGTYAGRFFYLDDFHGKASNYYAPGTDKVINFSFGGIDMDTCKIMSVDFWADLMIGAGTQLGPKCGRKAAGYTGGVWDNEANAMVGGSDDLETGLACSLRGLKAKDPSWRIALSVGGWTMSSEFSRCTRTAAKRKALVDSLQWHIDTYKLDIIDIDWEYPSKAGCGGGADDPCKAVVSRKNNYLPNKPEDHACDKGAIYEMYESLKSRGFKKLIELIDSKDVIGQTVSTAEACSQFHGPSWGGIPDGAAGMTEYWAGSITNQDWKHYIALLTDFKNKTYNGGKKMAVTTAVGMDTCSSKGMINGQQCSGSPGYRAHPAHPKGQGTSLKAFCDVQKSSGGYVNLMTYDYYGNWAAPYHNAPLYDNPNLRQYPDYLYEYNVDMSTRNWLKISQGGVQEESQGCNPSDLNVGLALYGRTFTKAGPFGKFGGKKPTQNLGIGTYQAGVISLWDVRHRFLTQAQGGKCDISTAWGTEQCGKWTLKRDVYAGCVPWLEIKNADGTYELISFDDDYSLALKAKWARCMGANGLLYWDAADDQDGLGSKASWEGWQSVRESECQDILQMSTSCPGAKGDMVCFGEEGDVCTGGPGPVTPEPEVPGPEPEYPTDPEGPTDPEYPGDGEEGTSPDSGCPGYQTCVEGCLNHLS